MFETLTSRLQEIFKKLKGRGKLSEADVTEVMREVRMALLEADVSLQVVRDFVARVKEKAVGQEVLESLTPAQSVIRIVNQELTTLMGSQQAKLEFSQTPPTLMMLVGLQGSGKTTTAAKLALYLRDQGHHPLLVAADIYRPAAIKQLQVLGEEVKIPVFSLGSSTDPVKISMGATEFARSQGRDVVLLDTAGRLHIDDEMMKELANIKANTTPSEILLVVDSMTGQDAVKMAEAFHKVLAITGVILTKLDGDARGGAALSIKAVTETSVKLVGVGEKLSALEVFHPERMASRILGMGDVLSLIEKAEQALDEKSLLTLQEKILKAEFTLEDYLDQLQQVRKMGSLDQLLGMLPGNLLGMFGLPKEMKGLQADEKELVRIEAIIGSMTREERRNPPILNGSRRKRIAAGSGVTVAEVNRVLKHYDQTRKMFKQLSHLERDLSLGKGKRGSLPKIKMPFMGPM